MKSLLVLLRIAAVVVSSQAHAQNGPPIRYPDPREWDEEERMRRLPPPRRFGPQMVPCIGYGECRGPQRYEEMPRRLPPPPPPGGRWYDDED